MLLTSMLLVQVQRLHSSFFSFPPSFNRFSGLHTYSHDFISLPTSRTKTKQNRTTLSQTFSPPGAETISHVYENGRVTIMFCSFAISPRIMRFFCTGKVVEWDEAAFLPLLRRMGKEKIEGARAVILLDVFKVRLYLSTL